MIIAALNTQNGASASHNSRIGNIEANGKGAQPKGREEAPERPSYLNPASLAKHPETPKIARCVERARASHSKQPD